MFGDRRHGIYNLRIVNVTLEDDAEFQCQVGPAPKHKVIRANATLTVICEYTFIGQRKSLNVWKMFFTWSDRRLLNIDVGLYYFVLVGTPLQLYLSSLIHKDAPNY